MKMVNISHGHALPGGVGCGATGYHDESKETKAITEKLVPMLNANGVESHDCSCNKHVDQNECLRQIVDAHNSYTGEDLSVSIHLNSSDNESAEGAEVLVYSESGSAYKKEVAERILEELKEAGFKTRGIKARTDLYFLRKCKSPSILVELYFCSNKKDCKLAEQYGHAGMARLICNGIVGHATHDISYGTKLRILKTVKLRDSKKADYNKVGELYPGDVVTVQRTNKNCTRAEIADGHWITLSAKCVEVID